MEILIIIGIVFIGWLLFEFATFLLPVIGILILLSVLFYLWHKKSKKNNYLNQTEVKIELESCFDRIKLFHQACHQNGGFVYISHGNLDTFDYNESDYLKTQPKVYTEFNFISTYTLETYEKACYNGDSELRIWAETSLAKTIFNISYNELKNGPLSNWYGSLFSNSQYDNSSERLKMVMYIYPPNIKNKNLTKEECYNYFVTKLEKMYEEYSKNQKN